MVLVVEGSWTAIPGSVLPDPTPRTVSRRSERDRQASHSWASFKLSAKFTVPRLFGFDFSPTWCD